jgi:hypothetical protein
LAACLLLCAGVSGAAPAGGLEYRLVADELDAFAFELRQAVTSEGHSSALIPEFTTRLSGELQRYVARIFRDGSLGVVARVISVEATGSRGDQSSSVDVTDLDGRSVSLRLTGRGELLDSVGWQELRRAGGQELLDDVFLRSVARLPARLPAPGRRETMSWRVAVTVQEGLSCAQTWLLAFSRSAAPQPEACRGSCALLDYEGTVSETCVDEGGGMVRSGEGEVSGQIALAGAGKRRALRSHLWRAVWQRRVESVAGADPAEALLQRTTTEGRLTSMEPSR